MKKLLFVTSRFPWPLEKGDKLRAYHLIKELSANYEVHLFAIYDQDPDSDSIKELNKYCKSVHHYKINRLTSYWNLIRNIWNTALPFQVAYFYSKRAAQSLQEVNQQIQPDLVFCHLIRMAPYIENLNPKKSVLDYMDTFSEGMKRLFNKSPLLIRPCISVELKRLVKYEFNLFDKFNFKTIISEQDKSWLPHPKREEILVLPNGVDSDFYTPQVKHKKYQLLFVGNMNYPPNIDAVTFVANQLMPMILKEQSTFQFLIAGANPSLKVQALASKNIVVSGWIDDVRIAFDESEIMIAPMQISIGLQNKILQGMSMEIPCIISSFANNALKAKPEHEVLIADTTEECYNQIRRLQTDQQLRSSIIQNAKKFILANYNWTNNVNTLHHLLTNDRSANSTPS